MDSPQKSIGLLFMVFIGVFALPYTICAAGDPEEPEIPEIPGIEPGDPPATAFEIDGSDLVYDRHDDFLFAYDEPVLSIRDSSDHEFRVEVINDNVLRVHNSGGSVLLIRIGSPEYKAMQEFIFVCNETRGSNCPIWKPVNRPSTEPKSTIPSTFSIEVALAAGCEERPSRIQRI